MDIAKGSIFEGKSSNIIYSFANSVEFGHLINILPKFKQEHMLMNKYFSELNITFTDQNYRPIDFMGSQITLTIEIRQCERVIFYNN